ncbi:MAG: hypothetical protein WCD52_27100, partial [Xanthobacteraceae bacterium]
PRAAAARASSSAKSMKDVMKDELVKDQLVLYGLVCYQPPLKDQIWTATAASTNPASASPR